MKQFFFKIIIILENIDKIIMLYFNSCPKCSKGTIEYNEDSQGKSITCLMCGFNKTSDSNSSRRKKTKIS